MSVRLDGAVIRLEGRCHVEDAEALLVLVQEHPASLVDCSAADLLHSAVIQVMIVAGTRVFGEFRDEFFRRWVSPMLARPEISD